MTKKLTRKQKARTAFARAFIAAGMSPRQASRMMRANWRNVLMPWRMIPQPVAFALIGLVALAMVLDMGEEEPSPAMGAPDTVTLTLGQYIPGESPCEEDELFDTVGVECVHIERVAPRHTQPAPAATQRVAPTMTPTPTATPTTTP